MHSLTRDRQSKPGYRYAFDPSDSPVLTVEPGAEVRIETEDSYHGQVPEKGHRNRSTEPRSNPLSGPIAVDGACRGDTLAVHVVDIEPSHGYASTYVPSWWWYLGPMGSRRAMDRFLNTPSPEEARVLPIEDGAVETDTAELPYEPMIGTLGTAPMRSPVPNGPAGPHGGNMDLPLISPGSTVYLPVSTDDALLYVGDAHALQGDAELTGVAAEMAADVTLKVDCISDHNISWPRIETDEAMYAVAAKTPFSTFEDAIRTAYVLLCNWLTTEYGIDRYEALRLCSLAGDLVVGNFNCVAAGIDRRAIQ